MQRSSSLMPKSSRLTRLYRENLTLFYAFLFPMAILAAAFFSRAVFPVGNRNILTIDLYHQYAPFIVELREKFTTLSSLFYTWNGGLGTNFWSLFAYYLASPLNILIVLFPPSYLTEAILVLVLVKIGLCGATFAAYLRGVRQMEGSAAVAFGTMYALSGYTMAYFWNIMWLDSLFLLPLVMLGLHRLVRERRFLLYVVSLGLVIYSNYYMAFFVCLFIVLYYPVCLFSDLSASRPGQLLGATGRFAGASLLAGGLASVLLLPTYFSLKLTSAAGDTFPRTVNHYFDLFDYIGQHYVMTPPSIREGMPNMYAGLAVLILLPVYFLSRTIPLKEKLLHLGLVFIMILSFNIDVLNFIWHGMHFPNQLPYRNSFVYIFLVLTMAAPAYTRLKEFTGKQIGAIGAMIALTILLSQKLNAKKPTIISLYVTLAVLVVYLATLTVDRVVHMTRQEMAMAFLLVVLAEMILNTFLMIHKVDMTEYLSDREGYLSGKEVDQIREQLAVIEEEEPDPQYYRVEILDPRTINDPFMYSFRGLSIFASTVPMKPVRLFENLGFHSNSINSYKNEGSTILLDTIFSIEYLIHRNPKTDDRLREIFASTDEITVYRNPYTSSIGYWVPSAITEWRSYVGSPFDAQNTLLEAMTGGKAVLKKLDLKPGDQDNLDFSGNPTESFSFYRPNADYDSTARIDVDNSIDQQVYLYLDIPANVAETGQVSIGDRIIDFNPKRATIIDLGHCLATEQIVVEIRYKGGSAQSSNFELYACGLNQADMAAAAAKLKNQAMTINQFGTTRIEGTVNAPTDGKVLMTIPYDAGWKVLVDGAAVETQALDDGLVLFDVPAGEHRLSLRFTPPKLLAGFSISLLSLLVLVLLVYERRRRERIRISAGFVPVDERPIPRRVGMSDNWGDAPDEKPMEAAPASILNLEKGNEQTERDESDDSDAD